MDLVDGHDCWALLLERRVEREGEVDLWEELGELADGGYDSDGRDREAPWRHAEHWRLGQLRQGVEDGGIGQWLAHAHERDAIDMLLALSKVQDLIGDLVGRELALDADTTRGAEGARERAAGLRRDADRRVAATELHVHGLDAVAVVQLEENLLGLRRDRRVHGRDREYARAERVSQELAGGYGERLDGVVGRGALWEEASAELLQSVGWLLGLGESRCC